MVNGTDIIVTMIYNLDHPANANIDRSSGVEVNDILPEAEPKFGKGVTLHVNPQTKEQWYEEFDRPLTPEEENKQLSLRVDNLTMQLGDALLGGGL
jgi:hypothetical protein